MLFFFSCYLAGFTSSWEGFMKRHEISSSVKIPRQVRRCLGLFFHVLDLGPASRQDSLRTSAVCFPCGYSHHPSLVYPSVKISKCEAWLSVWSCVRVYFLFFTRGSYGVYRARPQRLMRSRNETESSIPPRTSVEIPLACRPVQAVCNAHLNGLFVQGCVPSTYTNEPQRVQSLLTPLLFAETGQDTVGIPYRACGFFLPLTLSPKREEG